MSTLHPHEHLEHHLPRGTPGSYVLGFALSIALTLFAFWMAPLLPRGALYPALVAAALAQLVVQLVLFLHLGRESGPRWNLTAFAFMLVVVGILVVGTLWIMYNLQHMQVPLPTSADLFLHGAVAPQNQLQ